MFIARTSFDAMAHNVLFPELLDRALDAGLIVIVPYDKDKQSLGDMEAAIMFIPDAQEYARKLARDWNRSYWAVSYDSESGMVQIY